ncbi:MAG: ribbon-helix-helix domain-containing protein [Ectothiorhodospiraceae bacterium]|jgi:metal-responsive CopG/Arc/MetJ family transcriptional regulator|nr:ribbon-helix-helix domain-containing protein [Ectothiorhodospiraceae bacterium]
MNTVKIAISMDPRTLKRVDALVAAKLFPNRSRAIEAAIDEKLRRMEGSRLAAECAKLDPAFEKALAEEGMGEDADTWPAY